MCGDVRDVVVRYSAMDGLKYKGDLWLMDTLMSEENVVSIESTYRQ